MCQGFKIQLDESCITSYKDHDKNCCASNIEKGATFLMKNVLAQKNVQQSEEIVFNIWVTYTNIFEWENILVRGYRVK